MTNKKLNLTKYSYLDYLKGDIFSWLNCNDNYQIASEQDEQLRKLTPWRYKDPEEIEDDYDNESESYLRYGIEIDTLDFSKEIPDQIKAGLRVAEYSEVWAKNKWPNHKVVKISGYNNDENVKKTLNLLNENKDVIIFEANFKYNEFVTRTDILVKTDNKIKVIEVKGSGSTKLLYAMDLFFQKQIIDNSNLNKFEWDYSLLLLNKEYKHLKKYSKNEVADKIFINTDMVTNAHILGSKQIDEYDPIKKTSWRLSLNKYWENELIDWTSFEENPIFAKKMRGKNFTFRFKDLLKTTLFKKIILNFDYDLKRIKEIQLLDEPPKLEFEPRNNRWMKSDYQTWALKISGAYDVEDSLFDIRGNNVTWNKKCKFFKNGYKSMNDLPYEEIVSKDLYKKYGHISDESSIIHFLEVPWGNKVSGFSVPIQRNYFNKNESLVNMQSLDKELSQYKKFPIYMYDFETANLAIPEVEMSSPYEQIVYQYSIHVILDSENFDFKTKKNVLHYEWLADDRNNFHIDIWKNFVEVFKKHGEGIYVAWNKSFEQNCLKRALLNWSFDLEIENWMEKICDETIDLMIPFRNKYYYHKDLKGSYSIKYVGPHLVENEIDYSKLNLVQKGDQSAAVAKMWLRDNSTESDSLWLSRRKDMLKYCEYDTLLMVAILQRIKEKIYD